MFSPVYLSFPASQHPQQITDPVSAPVQIIAIPTLSRLFPPSP